LPFTVLRRLDCVLANTREAVWKKAESLKSSGIREPEEILNRSSKVGFHNVSKFDFGKLKGDPNHLAHNLTAYIRGFSSNARDVIERFKFAEQIAKLDESNLLFKVLSKFAEVDLHPTTVPNHVLGSIFEELIRRFSEESNETAGEHFTPRDVIRLMVDLLFLEDDDALRKPGIVRTLYDPACGTGGMLSVAEEYLRELNPEADLVVFGQELNDESFAICKSDMLIKGQNPANIVRGNSFSEDGHVGKKFDYMLSTPPFGVEWKKVQKEIEDEHETQGYAGRFGPGLPRINDGSLLFLLHMISKMKPVNPKTGEGGSRIAVVFNGSPLFTGDAGSGESEIRRWIIENDWLEAIVAMPDQHFYNTGISTYLWVLTNRKAKPRRGKIQLIDARNFWIQMKKSLGNKRHKIGDPDAGERDDIGEITRIYGNFTDGETRKLNVDGTVKELVVSKIFDNADFGFHKITVERPFRLAFEITDDKLAALEHGTTAIAKVDKLPAETR